MYFQLSTLKKMQEESSRSAIKLQEVKSRNQEIMWLNLFGHHDVFSICKNNKILRPHKLNLVY